MPDFKEAKARLRETAQSLSAGADCEANPLVEVDIDPFGEGATYFVDWEARPRSFANSVWLVEVIITPDLPDVGRTDYIVQARESGGRIPANLALNGSSAHTDIPPGTRLRIFLIGNIQVDGDPFRYFCFEKTVVTE
jgi:hypothetical protein